MFEQNADQLLELCFVYLQNSKASKMCFLFLCRAICRYWACAKSDILWLRACPVSVVINLALIC